jgi:hypothetical protein
VPVSKKRKKGSGKKVPRSPRPAHVRRDDLPPVDGIVRTLLRGGNELLQVDDPFDAERWASAFLGTVYKRLPWGEEDRFFERVFDGVVEEAGRASDPASLAVLRAFASLAPEPHDITCAKAGDELAARGVPEPSWARGLGEPTFARAWTLTDVFEDQTAYYAHFRYPGQGEHLIGAVLDENLGGIVKDAAAGVLMPGADPRATAEADPKAVVGDVDAGELAARVLAAIDTGDMYIDNAWTDEFRELRALLLSRMAQLPAIVLPEPVVASDDEREAIIDAFLASPGAPADDDSTRGILDQCLTARCDFGDGDPFRWSPIVVEMFLLDYLPRKGTLDVGQIRALPDVLRGWIRYALTRRGVDERHIEGAVAVVGELEAEFRRQVTDPNNFGLAKAISSAMLTDGVDLLDEEAVGAWIEGFNARPFEQRDDFLAGRMGIELDPRLMAPPSPSPARRPTGGMPTGWYAIRVELVSGGGDDLEPQPGRDFLVSPQHTFRQLADSINAGFGRWDLAHLYEFRMADGTRIGIPDDEDDPDVRDVVRTKVATRSVGEVFEFVFDFGDSWRHRCTVLEAGVDPSDDRGGKPQGSGRGVGLGEHPGSVRALDPGGLRPGTTGPTGLSGVWSARRCRRCSSASRGSCPSPGSGRSSRGPRSRR